MNSEIRLLVLAFVGWALVMKVWSKPDPNHWSFHEVAERSVPDLGEKNGIDGFLLQRLKEEGLSFSKRAEPVNLLRRIFLDLTGLPPTPDEIDSFEKSWKEDASEAYNSAVERLLVSPRYGERWGQHWLDAVRFAETHGFEVNTPRPNAWPYRDYVIRAFNEDLPYDQFVFEQLAGDTVSKDAATGFLVTAAALLRGQVGKDDESIKRARQDELNEIVINTSATFLGLTVHCARCHDHKFDAISQKDYHRMQAIFGGVRYGNRPLRDDSEKREEEIRSLDMQIALVEQGLKKMGVRLPVSPLLNTESFAPILARYLRFTIRKTNGVEPCIDELEVWSSGEKSTNVALASNDVVASSSGDYQDPSKHRLEYINDGKYGNGRSWIASETQGGWVILDFGKPILINRVTWGRDRKGVYKDRLPIDYVIEVAADKGAWQEVAGSKGRLMSLDPSKLGGAQRSAVLDHQSLSEARRRLDGKKMIFGGVFQKPPPMHLLNRGDVAQPKEEVSPGIPEVFGSLEMSSATSDVDRRKGLARWIASPKNPLTARVMVNRVWHLHFGAGLVNTPSDFGGMGGKPSHPGLLDWLAVRFVKDGWSIKNLHRLILSSKAYQQSGRPSSLGMEKDANNRLLWRFQPRRLEAEAIRDSILQVSGSLDLKMGGPGFSFFEPNTNYVRVYNPKEEFGPLEWRRMIYGHRVRMEQDGVFGAFDRPDAGLICSKRTQSTTPLQSLNLFNSRFVEQQSEIFSKRLVAEAGEKVNGQIVLAFQYCFGRVPTAEEVSKGLDFVNQHGLSQFCRVLFNTNEFLFLP